MSCESKIKFHPLKTSHPLKTRLEQSVIAVLLLLLTACGGGLSDDGGVSDVNDNTAPRVQNGKNLVLFKQSQSSKLPAVVTVSFKVETDLGEPVAGLTKENFTLEENGVEVSQSESSSKVIPDAGEFIYSTLLLLDFSDSVVKGGIEELKQAAISFVDNVIPPVAQGTGNQELSIAIFDGSANIRMISSSFLTNQDNLKEAIRALDSTFRADGSTNLYGAVVEGISLLGARLTNNAVEDRELLSAGAVVLFTDGTDRAGRTTKEAALRAVSQASNNMSVFTIGLKGETDVAVLKSIGVDGYQEAANLTNLVSSFEKIGRLISDETNSYYILDYCSPKRGGAVNTLVIKANSDGRLGSLSTPFDAQSFGGFCDDSSL